MTRRFAILALVLFAGCESSRPHTEAEAGAPGASGDAPASRPSASEQPPAPPPAPDALLGSCPLQWSYAVPAGRTLRFAGVVDLDGNLHGLECDSDADSATCEHVSWERTGAVRFRAPLAGPGVATLMRVGPRVVLFRLPFDVEARAAATGALLWHRDLEPLVAAGAAAPPEARITGMAARGEQVLLSITRNAWFSETTEDGAFIALTAETGAVELAQPIPTQQDAFYIYNVPNRLFVNADGDVWTSLRAAYDGAARAVRLAGPEGSRWKDAVSVCPMGQIQAATRAALIDGYWDDGGGIGISTPEHLKRTAEGRRPICPTGMAALEHLVTPERVIGLSYEGDVLHSVRIDPATLAALPDEDFTYDGLLEWQLPEQFDRRWELSSFVATDRETFLFVETQREAPRLRERSARTGLEVFTCPLSSGTAYLQDPVTLTGGLLVLATTDEQGRQTGLHAFDLAGRSEAPEGWVSSGASTARDFQERIPGR